MKIVLILLHCVVIIINNNKMQTHVQIVQNANCLHIPARKPRGNEETEKCNVNKIKQSTTMSTILLVVTLPFARLSQCLTLCSLSLSLSLLGNSLGLQWQMSVFYKKNGSERIIHLPTTIDNSSVHPYVVIKYCNKSHCTHQQNDSTVDNNVADLGVNAMIENQSKKSGKGGHHKTL